MTNPCVIIATHDRLKITTINIEQLISQGVAVVLVITDINERDHYENYDVNIVMAPNKPLGAKWQAGVDFAIKGNHTHYVITGSDDLLSIGFFEKYCTDKPFTGFKRWYIWHEEKQQLHLIHYRPLQPLGGGRVFTRWAIERLNYQLWNPTKNKLLDDYAFKSVAELWQIHHRPEILAVKGNWPVMNRVDLNHYNIRVLATYEGEMAHNIMRDKFNYEP